MKGSQMDRWQKSDAWIEWRDRRKDRTDEGGLMVNETDGQRTDKLKITREKFNREREILKMNYYCKRKQKKKQNRSTCGSTA